MALSVQVQDPVALPPRKRFLSIELEGLCAAVSTDSYGKKQTLLPSSKFEQGLLSCRVHHTVTYLLYFVTY